jgi:hypothetical protein
MSLAQEMIVKAKKPLYQIITSIWKEYGIPFTILLVWFLYAAAIDKFCGPAETIFSFLVTLLPSIALFFREVRKAGITGCWILIVLYADMTLTGGYTASIH